jgi:hypothetical protein
MIKSIVTYILAFLAALLIIGIYSIVFGFPVMLLWNWVLPAVIGASRITFWQSVGLNLLCGILIRGMTTIRG